MKSITANSSIEWLLKRGSLQFKRYLRQNHKKIDWDIVKDLILQNPDEGKKLVESYYLTEFEKKRLFYFFLLTRKQITLGGFGDQRTGKDVTINSIFDETIQFIKEYNESISSNYSPFIIPRFVTLGNTKKPPFVKHSDMYFSLRDIPIKEDDQEIWIYSSEAEIQFPARETSGYENKIYSQMTGTMAQNGQKYFGIVKLASRVDINFIRDMNCSFYKYILPSKLKVENSERTGILSSLGKFLLPSNSIDLSETLLVFDDNLFKVKYSLPKWWSEDYSKQFYKISDNIAQSIIKSLFENGISVSAIETIMIQKYRLKYSQEQIKTIIH